MFEDQKVINDRLKDAVDRQLSAIKDARWHYESRVKTLLSVALKLETGRVPKPSAIEDFFACTLVVANGSEIARAEGLVRQHFVVTERRPGAADKTHKAPDQFPFDDLRLYVTLGKDPALPVTDLHDVTFELQIKTFLQHAWSIATHDLVYKSDDVNWGKERIAYQTKAMLEHAELAIQEAERLSGSTSLAMQDRKTVVIKTGIELLRRQWGADELPADVRRVALNVQQILDALRLSIERLDEILEAAKRARSGTHPANLSPYATIVQCLLVSETDAMKRLLENRNARMRVLIAAEIELPTNFDRNALPNAVFVP